MEAEERVLIEAAQTDPSRFAELYENNFNRVYAYVASRVRDRFEAQDLTADVFHQALANLKQYQWRGVPFVSWLLRIASNAIVDHSRRVARQRNLPPPDDPDEVDFDQGANHARLFQCVNSLPVDQRRVVVLRFSEQKSIREIAEEMNRTEGAIKQLQFRALQNLRVRMGETNG
jgi:RNA polymerase sigma-70 factor (ECF subfamily)